MLKKEEGKLERINESIAAIMPAIEKELWEELSNDELKELDILLRAKWNSMLKALEQNDIDKAVNYFHHTASDRYRKLFKTLNPDGRKKIGKDLANIQIVEVVTNTAIYEITSELKGEKSSFQLAFVKDCHGEWGNKVILEIKDLKNKPYELPRFDCNLF